MNIRLLYFQEYIASSISLDIVWFNIIGVVDSYWERTDPMKIVKRLYYIEYFKLALGNSIKLFAVLLQRLHSKIIT